MSDDITQRLRVTMPDLKDIEISCPCRIRSSLMKEAADEIEKLARERNEARAEVEKLRETLGFYADKNHYMTRTVHMCGHSVGEPVLLDKGRQARNALEGGR